MANTSGNICAKTGCASVKAVVATIAAGTYGNITLKAQWEVSTFRVVYDANAEGVSVPTAYFVFGNAFILAGIPTGTTQTFKGWKVVSKEGNWPDVGTILAAGASIAAGRYGRRASSNLANGRYLGSVNGVHRHA